MNPITAFVSPKGGCGAGFVCAGVWASFALGGKKVLAVDFGFEKSTLDFALGFQSDYIYTLQDVLNGNCTLDEALVCSPKAENAFYIKADYEYTGMEFGRIAEALAETDFEYILMDIPVNDVTQSLVDIADTVIVVTDPSEISVRMCQEFCQRYEMPECFILINKIIPAYIRAGIHLTVDEIMERTGLYLKGLVPWDSEGEIILKQGVLNRKPDGVSTKAFDNIAKRIAGENVPAMDMSDKYDCFKLSKKFVLKNE